METTKYSTIHDVKDIWDKYIARNNMCLSSSFMSLIERLYPSDEFIYYTVTSDNKLISILFFCRKKIPVIFPMLGIHITMTATFETYGKHYWYDKSYFTELEFTEMMYSLGKKIKSSLIVIRDYFADVSCDLDSYFMDNGFKGINIPELSIIRLNSQQTPDFDFNQYLYSLKKKHRNYYRKVIEGVSISELNVVHIKNFGPYVDRLYPLYKATNMRAKEYRTAPMPIAFLQLSAEIMKDNASCILLQSKSNDIYGFVLLYESDYELVPFLMGTKDMPELHLWHILTLEAIKYAISRKIYRIDMGITNSSMKNRLGAEQFPIRIYGRFKNRFVNILFGKFLHNILLS